MRLGGFWIGALLLAVGCRHESQVDRFAREYREQQASRFAKAKLETVLFKSLTDEKMVAQNQKDGLGLGLRVEGTELRVGEPLRVHLAYKNIAVPVPVPVSATTCQGFTLSQEDEAAVQTNAVSIVFACPKEDPMRDNPVALPKGQLKTADLSGEETRLSFPHPGRYIVMAGWQSFRPSEGLFLRGSEYSVLGSNQVVVTVR